MSPFRSADAAPGVLSAVLEASDDSILVVDSTGCVRSWNHAAERLLGFAASEAVGQEVGLIVPRDQRDAFAALLDRVRSGDRIDAIEIVTSAKDGRRIDVSLTASPVRDSSGAIIGATLIGRDLTARKRADAALLASDLRWRSVIDSAVDAIVVIDGQGRIEAFNPAAVRLFGYSEAELIGHNVNELMPSPYREEHDGYIGRYLSTHERRIIGIGREVTAKRKDGSTFPVHLSVGEMNVGGTRKFTGILHDLTTRVRMEEQLREQTSLVRLGEMAAVLAHEIKNPLAGVRGAIQVIGTRLPADSRDALMIREIIARIDALNELMKDLLLFARPPQPRPAPIDVAALIATTAGLVKSDPALREVQVTVEGAAPTIAADADLLTIVFENLFVNAAHALNGRGAIRVSADIRDGVCLIEVHDAGPGIAPDVREKIFTPFFTTKARGSGLGLPTAKRLVEAHGGTIGIDCPPGGGTTVTVRLPVGRV